MDGTVVVWLVVAEFGHLASNVVWLPPSTDGLDFGDSIKSHGLLLAKVFSTFVLLLVI